MDAAVVFIEVVSRTREQMVLVSTEQSTTESVSLFWVPGFEGDFPRRKQEREQEKEVKSIQIRKEKVMPSLFAHDMILHRKL